MIDPKTFRPPATLDWQSWVDRWDRMQERYLVNRTERFQVIARLIRATQRTVARVEANGSGLISFSSER